MKRKVYLDHQASTPILAEVREAMLPWLTDWFGNPGSQHSHGLRARDAVQEARGRAARMIGAAGAGEIFFTSGATEAANLAVKGVAFASRGRGRHIVLSVIEHPSVLNSAAWLESQGFQCTRVGCDAQGFLDPAAFERAIRADTILIATHHSNHDVGAVQPVAEIAVLGREKGIPVFCDASSSGGWLPVDVNALGVQLLSLAPHRFYGPKGAGILYRHRQARLESLIHGGKQEGGLRAGTENVAAIVGTGVACEIAARELDRRAQSAKPLQQKLAEGLLRTANSRLNGPVPGPRRSPVNINLSFGGVEGESLLLLCDMQGIALGSGPSCVAQNLARPYVLEAMGVSAEDAKGNVVMTLGKDNTAEQIDYVLDTLPRLVDKLRAMSPGWKQL